MVVAVAVVVAAVGGLLLYYEHNATRPAVTPIHASADPYAANLVISNLAMSESANLSGGKVTYLDGHIVNRGNRTVTGAAMQVLFRNVVGEVAQNETQPLRIIRTRQPYVDLEPLSTAPLKPGDAADFRLAFDAVAEQWNGAFPDLRIVHVDFQ